MIIAIPLAICCSRLISTRIYSRLKPVVPEEQCPPETPGYNPVVDGLFQRLRGGSLFPHIPRCPDQWKHS